MLWPALTWSWEWSGTGTAYSRSASANLYHADSMTSPCDGAVVCLYKSTSSPAGAVLYIAIVFRAVLCAVRINQEKKELFFLELCFIESKN